MVDTAPQPAGAEVPPEASVDGFDGFADVTAADMPTPEGQETRLPSYIGDKLLAVAVDLIGNFETGPLRALKRYMRKFHDRQA